jgi:hypothetical protein
LIDISSELAKRIAVPLLFILLLKRGVYCLTLQPTVRVIGIKCAGRYNSVPNKI